MIKKQAIETFVRQYFPWKNKLKKDICGWQGYRKRQEFVKAVIALEISWNLVNFAVKNQVDLIIVHHPFYYPRKSSKCLRGWKAKLHEVIINAKIAILVLHTNYDVASEGMNAMMLKSLGYDNAQLDNDQISWKVKLPKPIDPLSMAKQLLPFSHQNIFTYANCDHLVDNLQICAGSGSSVVGLIQDQKTLFITGELKWSDWRTVDVYQQPVIVLSHNMEQFFVNSLQKLMLKEVATITAADLLTFTVKNPINYFLAAKLAH